jgi:ankyrin repeat protein
MSVASDDGMTPLHEAAMRSSRAVVKLLLDAGSDLSATDQHVKTPLHRALRHGDRAVIRRPQRSHHRHSSVTGKRGILFRLVVSFGN